MTLLLQFSLILVYFPSDSCYLLTLYLLLHQDSRLLFFTPLRLGLLSGQTANKLVFDHFQSLCSFSASSNPPPPFSLEERPVLITPNLIYPSISPFLITAFPANLIFHQPLEPSHADSLINQTDSKAHTQDYRDPIGYTITCICSIVPHITL